MLVFNIYRIVFKVLGYNSTDIPDVLSASNVALLYTVLM